MSDSPWLDRNMKHYNQLSVNIYSLGFVPKKSQQFCAATDLLRHIASRELKLLKVRE